MMTEYTFSNDGNNLILEGDFGYMTFDNETYFSSNINFYSPSLHTFANKHLPLEMQIMHHDQTGTKQLSISILFRYSENDYSLFLAKLGFDSKKLQNQEPFKPVTLKEEIDLSRYVTEGKDFFIYNGMDDKPPCEKNTTYLILTDVLKVSKKQLNNFPIIVKNKNRIVQKRNGRNIFTNFQMEEVQKKKEAIKAKLDAINKQKLEEENIRKIQEEKEGELLNKTLASEINSQYNLTDSNKTYTLGNENVTTAEILKELSLINKKNTTKLGSNNTNDTSCENKDIIPFETVQEKVKAYDSYIKSSDPKFIGNVDESLSNETLIIDKELPKSGPEKEREEIEEKFKLWKDLFQKTTGGKVDAHFFIQMKNLERDLIHFNYQPFLEHQNSFESMPSLSFVQLSEKEKFTGDEDNKNLVSILEKAKSGDLEKDLDNLFANADKEVQSEALDKAQKELKKQELHRKEVAHVLKQQKIQAYIEEETKKVKMLKEKLAQEEYLKQQVRSAIKKVSGINQVRVQTSIDRDSINSHYEIRKEKVVSILPSEPVKLVTTSLTQPTLNLSKLQQISTSHSKLSKIIEKMKQPEPLKPYNADFLPKVPIDTTRLQKTLKNLDVNNEEPKPEPQPEPQPEPLKPYNAELLPKVPLDTTRLQKTLKNLDVNNEEPKAEPQPQPEVVKSVNIKLLPEVPVETTRIQTTLKNVDVTLHKDIQIVEQPIIKIQPVPVIPVIPISEVKVHANIPVPTKKKDDIKEIIANDEYTQLQKSLFEEKLEKYNRLESAFKKSVIDTVQEKIIDSSPETKEIGLQNQINDKKSDVVEKMNVKFLAASPIVVENAQNSPAMVKIQENMLKYEKMKNVADVLTHSYGVKDKKLNDNKNNTNGNETKLEIVEINNQENKPSILPIEDIFDTQLDYDKKIFNDMKLIFENLLQQLKKLDDINTRLSKGDNKNSFLTSIGMIRLSPENLGTILRKAILTNSDSTDTDPYEIKLNKLNEFVSKVLLDQNKKLNGQYFDSVSVELSQINDVVNSIQINDSINQYNLKNMNTEKLKTLVMSLLQKLPISLLKREKSNLVSEGATVNTSEQREVLDEEDIFISEKNVKKLRAEKKVFGPNLMEKLEGQVNPLPGQGRRAVTKDGTIEKTEISNTSAWPDKCK
jgi:carbonic anhydrase